MAQEPIAARKIKKYGWIPDLPDARDHLFAAPHATMVALPKSVDLRPLSPAVYDQGELGSCTANAIGGAIQFARMKNKFKDAATLTPSRLFIYYNERRIEGSISIDSGAMLRDGIKSVVKEGTCFETGPESWPYVISKFTKKPPATCYSKALQNQVQSYSRLVNSAAQLKGCLASGYPFVFGFTVYESFESSAATKTGIVPMPSQGESTLGGHAVLAVGYNDATQRFIIRNSWGPKQGDKGYYYMPYNYLTDSNLSDDFWTIRLVEG